jgi:hypothetical protein
MRDGGEVFRQQAYEKGHGHEDQDQFTGDHKKKFARRNEIIQFKHDHSSRIHPLICFFPEGCPSSFVVRILCFNNG